MAMGMDLFSVPGALARARRRKQNIAPASKLLAHGRESRATAFGVGGLGEMILEHESSLHGLAGRGGS